MTRWVHTIRAVAICGWILATGIPSFAQEYVPVEVKDVKESPQRFWARGIVFRDVLKEYPGDKTIRVADQSITRFKLGTLGEVYATEELVSRIASLPLDVEYLLSGTVGQRGKKFLFMGNPKYFFLIKDISAVQIETKSIPEQLAAINRGISTNIYNRVFASLEAVMAEVQKDLFAYATSQNIPLETVFDVNAGHMPKVMSSINAALRRAEDRSRMPMQEFLASVIAAMMANRSGFVEEVPQTFVPEAMPIDPVIEESSDAGESSWDLTTTPDTARENMEESPDKTETVTESPAVVDVEEAAVTKPASTNEAVGLDDPFWKEPEPTAVLETKTAVELVDEMINEALDKEPVTEEKPSKKKKAKKTTIDPVPENVVTQEEPAAAQSEIDEDKPLPLQ